MQRCVLAAISVVLKLLVAPALAAGFANPFGTVNGGSVGAVEFITPDQLLAGALRGNRSGLRVADCG